MVTLRKTAKYSSKSKKKKKRKNQSNAWITTALLIEWHDSIFILEGKKIKKAIGEEGTKVILDKDGHFKTLFLPPNVEINEPTSYRNYEAALEKTTFDTR